MFNLKGIRATEFDRTIRSSFVLTTYLRVVKTVQRIEYNVLSFLLKNVILLAVNKALQFERKKKCHSSLLEMHFGVSVLILEEESSFESNRLP